jgi:hypothetical protein
MLLQVTQHERCCIQVTVLTPKDRKCQPLKVVFVGLIVNSVPGAVLRSSVHLDMSQPWQ